MGSGIIIKIWNIKANANGKSASAQISDSVKYITNREKCKYVIPASPGNPGNGSVLTADTSGQMERELKYVVNEIKTMEGLYSGGINILDIRNATDEMMKIKEFYRKTDGRVALHGIISLPHEESDPQNAGRLIMLLTDLMKEIYPEHQVVYAVHTNTENLHIHFIVNTVSLDGKKIHMDQKFMRKTMEPAVNRLAGKYGFTPNENWKEKKERDIYPIAERKIMLRTDIDLAIEQSDDYEGFLKHLKEKGYTANNGTILYLKKEGMEKAMPTYILGTHYSVDGIKERLAIKRMPFEHVKTNAASKKTDHTEMVSFVPKVMKKYADMEEEEKRKVVKLLKLGKNPWQKQYSTNWRIDSAARELDSLAAVDDIIGAYSAHSLTEAKQKIIEVEKQLAAEKKMVRSMRSRYRPQIKIYEEMASIARRAYLFETAGILEYEDEYKKYSELQERLMSGYSKTPAEVAAYVEDLKDQLLYLQAQKEELSRQYQILDKHEKLRSRNRNETEAISIFEAVGHTQAKLQAKRYHILTPREITISSVKENGYVLRVLTTPDLINGNATVTTRVTVLTMDNEVVEEFDSKEYPNKEFSDQLYRIRNEYGFLKCIVHSGSNGKQKIVLK